MMSQFPDRRKWRGRALEDSQFVPPWLARPAPQPAPDHNSEAGIATYTTETLIGWRGWSLHRGKLVSLFNAVEWPFRKSLVVEDDTGTLPMGQ
jgi:hypothetical protein